MDSYPMSDYDDDDESLHRRPLLPHHKRDLVPPWAQHESAWLRDAVAAQDIDGAPIFGAPAPTCDLRPIFGRSPSRHKRKRKREWMDPKIACRKYLADFHASGLLRWDFTISEGPGPPRYTMAHTMRAVAREMGVTLVRGREEEWTYAIERAPPKSALQYFMGEHFRELHKKHPGEPVAEIKEILTAMFPKAPPEERRNKFYPRLTRRARGSRQVAADAVEGRLEVGEADAVPLVVVDVRAGVEHRGYAALEVREARLSAVA
ncbi:helicase [Aureococcus anophagefferens]|nr:helicase [Aureococcus anophagefferens]